MLQLASGNVSMLVATSGPPDMMRPALGKLDEMGWVMKGRVSFYDVCYFICQKLRTAYS